MDDSRSSRDRIELYVEGETMHLNMDVLVKRGQNGYYVKCILSQIASDIIQVYFVYFVCFRFKQKLYTVSVSDFKVHLWIALTESHNVSVKVFLTCHILCVHALFNASLLEHTDRSRLCKQRCVFFKLERLNAVIIFFQFKVSKKLWFTKLK